MPVFPFHVPLNLFLGKPREVNGGRPVRFDIAGENVHFVEEYESLGYCQSLEVQSTTQWAYLGSFFWCRKLVQPNRFSPDHPSINVDPAVWMEHALGSLKGDAQQRRKKGDGCVPDVRTLLS